MLFMVTELSEKTREGSEFMIEGSQNCSGPCSCDTKFTDMYSVWVEQMPVYSKDMPSPLSAQS